MKKKFLFLTAILISCCFYLTVQAQEPDSGYLNLGRTTLKEEFTQNFSIKPEYLEKMPFTNLTEAISAWLYGNYSNTSTIVYVVDGNIALDVNAYNIYDIEQITLVQNAVTQLNGATGQAQLVVIKTKRNRPPGSGVTIAGQLFQINNTHKDQSGHSDYASDNNLYHQYTITAYRNKKNLQYGASVNYQRDVLPSIKADSITTLTPENINRFRINTYLNIQLGKKNELLVNVNYTPQRAAFNQLNEISESSFKSSIKEDLHQKEKLFTPWIRWFSRISKCLSNDFIAGYDLSHTNGSLSADENSTFPTGTNSETISTAIINNKYHDLFFKDQIHYTRQIGEWRIEPMLDIHYRHTNNNSVIEKVSSSYPQSINQTISYTKLIENQYYLTPSVNLFYKDILSLQAGIVNNLGKAYVISTKKNFPFISGSLDVLKMAGRNNINSLKLFASYAGTADLNDPNYQLTDFTPSHTSENKIFSNFSGNYVIGVFANGIPNAYYQINHSTWTALLGFCWSVFHNRLFISYNYERRAFNAPVEITVPSQGNNSIEEMIYPLVVSSTHRLSIHMKIAETKKLDLFSGVAVANLSINKNTGYYIHEYATGDYASSKPSFTGSWVNRGRFRHLLFGFDILYHLREQVLPEGGNFLPYIEQIKNCWLLQNIYMGYKIRSAEVYISGRNVLQNSTGNLSNGNRYYGVGLKYAIF